MKHLRISTFLILIFSFLFVSHSFSQSSQKKSELEWKTLEEVDQLMQTAPKKILIFFYADWCGVCKKMDRRLFTNPEVVGLLNEDFYPVRFNAELKETTLFDGINYEFIEEQGNGFNGFAYELLEGQKIMPTLVFLDEEKYKINKFQGYQPEHLVPIYLRYLSEDAYKTQDWFEYSNQQ